MTYHDSLDVNRPGFLGGGSWQLNNLNRVTVILGKNGSGKSILLRNLRDQNPEGRHYVAPERAGDIRYQSNQLDNQIDGQDRANQVNQDFVNRYRQQVIARIQAYLTKRGSFRSEKVPLEPGVLEELMSPVLSDFQFKIEKGKPPYSIERIDSGERVNNAGQLSSGETEAITLAVDTATICAIWELEHEEERLLLLDEPDTHLHPDLQERMADFIVQTTKRFDTQVIVATHSTTLLSALGQYGGEETAVTYLNLANDRFEAEQFDRRLKEVSAVLGGHVLMGPLFGAPILFVEGDDDYKIWSEVPRHHEVNLAAIPCNGEEIFRYQKLTEKIFSSLRDNHGGPIGYALLDGDQTVPDPNPNNPQDHIKYVQLECHEAENLYLSDETLSEIGLTWDEAMNRIEDRADEFGEKEEDLLRVIEEDRRTSELKPVIRELSRIVDPKELPWTLRLGKVLGKGELGGQLRGFLGEDVIRAIWGEDGGDFDEEE